MMPHYNQTTHVSGPDSGGLEAVHALCYNPLLNPLVPWTSQLSVILG